MIIFFYGTGCFFVRCCRKYLQCRSARFFRSSSTDVVFRPTPACFHLLGKENISQPWQKHMQDSPIVITTDIFQPTLCNFVYKRWLIIFFYGRGCFFVRCCRKYLQCRSARFFRSSSTEVVFRPTPACLHLLGKENISQPRQKHMQDSAILNGKNVSRRLPGKMTDRGLKKKHHRITRIEHFLIDIIQIFFRDWIQSTIDDNGRCKATTDIFHPTLRNFFYKRWPIIFFCCRGFFFVRCCRENLQCRSARFFRSSSTEVVFWSTPTCFHLLGKDNISQPRQFHMNDSPIVIGKNAS